MKTFVIHRNFLSCIVACVYLPPTLAPPQHHQDWVSSHGPPSGAHSSSPGLILSCPFSLSFCLFSRHVSGLLSVSLLLCYISLLCVLSLSSLFLSGGFFSVPGTASLLQGLSPALHTAFHFIFFGSLNLFSISLSLAFILSTTDK